MDNEQPTIETEDLVDVPSVYNYHPVSKALVSITMADPDPLEPDRWLLPAHATFLAAPVVSEHEVAVFDDAAQDWVVVLRSVLDQQQEERKALTLEEQVSSFLAFVDTQADALMKAVLGERSQEYLVAEAQAKEYADALAQAAEGEVVEVPEFVASWSDAALMEPAQAAQDILENARVWRDALGLLRRIRLKAKKNAERAPDFSTLSGVAAQWGEDFAMLRNNLGA